MDGSNDKVKKSAKTQPETVQSDMANSQDKKPSSKMLTKKISKKAALIWGIVGVVVLVVAVVVSVLAIYSFGTPNRDDYNKSFETLDSVDIAHNKIADNFYELTTSSDAVSVHEKLSESMKKNRDAVNEKLDELGKMKAVTNDKEVKEKYDAIIAKRQDFNKFVDVMLELSEKLAPIVKKLPELSFKSEPAEFEAAIKSLEETSLSDETLNKYKDAMINLLKAKKERRLAVIRAPFGAIDGEIVIRYKKALNDFQDVVKDSRSSLNKKYANANLKTDIREMRKLLKKKIEEAQQ